MNFPRKTSARWLAVLTLAASAALPLWRASAQSAPAKASSPNGKIVFQSTQGGDGLTSDIYVMDADGKHQTRLTDNTTADDASPLWSPSGGQIAFFSNRGGDYEIYLMGADGTNQRPLRSAANGGPISGGSVEWSPDGTRLAYVAGSDAYVIQVVGLGGDSTAPPVSISTGKAAGSDDVQVSWSPSGGRLVVRNATACGGCSDLYTVNADGTGRTLVTGGAGFDIDARWSPAGALIAYEADRGGRGIYVKNADGTGAETLVSGAAGSVGGPEWSPDGTRLAFKSGSGNVYVVNADGSRKATNYTKSRRDDEFASTWQRLATQ